jgi:uncharacterized protein with beta-barrel porin domain
MQKAIKLLLIGFCVIAVAQAQAEPIKHDPIPLAAEKGSHNSGNNNNAQNTIALNNAIADLKKLKAVVETATSDTTILKMHHLSHHAIRKMVAGFLQVWSSIYLFKATLDDVSDSEALILTAQILAGIAMLNGSYEFTKGATEAWTGDEHALHLPHALEIIRKLVAAVGQAALGTFCLSLYDNQGDGLRNLAFPIAATVLMLNSCCDLASARVEWKKTQLTKPAKGLCMIEHRQEDAEEEDV